MDLDCDQSFVVATDRHNQRTCMRDVCPHHVGTLDLTLSPEMHWHHSIVFRNELGSVQTLCDQMCRPHRSCQFENLARFSSSSAADALNVTSSTLSQLYNYGWV